MKQHGNPHSVCEVLQQLNELARHEKKVSLGDVVEAFGDRSYGPFLLVPALIEISPIGGIPGVPTFLAFTIIIFAAQMVVGRRCLWLPEFLSKRAVSADKLDKATQKLRPVAARMDRWFHGRLPALTKGPIMRAAAIVSILMALSVPPLELLPFASTVPMAAIAAFGLALLVRDGALMIVALLLAGATLALGIGLGLNRGLDL